MVVAVIDDQLLLEHLTGATEVRGRFATTCSWWWRLASALNGSRRGALTRQVESLGAVRSDLVRSVIVSPALRRHIQILELADLIPAMGALVRETQLPLNQLAAESVAAAAIFGVGIEVGVDSPQIAACAVAVGVPYLVRQTHD